jgi:integrase/recombinase XerD
VVLGRVQVVRLVGRRIPRAEVPNLNWGDVDFSTGAVLVRRGKGGKARVTAIEATTRRGLLAYRRSLSCFQSDTPLFVTVFGKRMTRPGLRSIFPRLSMRPGILVTPHILRRTFPRQSLRQGMDLIALQRLMGQAGLSMTSRYVKFQTQDLLAEHEDHALDAWLRS